jgi:putative endonuclease
MFLVRKGNTMSDWVVYGLICSRNGEHVTYIGVTNNYASRYKAHISGKGAKFTRSFTPQCGAILEKGLTRSIALSKEKMYKRLSSGLKIDLIRRNCESL